MNWRANLEITKTNSTNYARAELFFKLELHLFLLEKFLELSTTFP